MQATMDGQITSPNKPTVSDHPYANMKPSVQFRNTDMTGAPKQDQSPDGKVDRQGSTQQITAQSLNPKESVKTNNFVVSESQDLTNEQRQLLVLEKQQNELQLKLMKMQEEFSLQADLLPPECNNEAN